MSLWREEQWMASLCVNCANIGLEHCSSLFGVCFFSWQEWSGTGEEINLECVCPLFCVQSPLIFPQREGSMPPVPPCSAALQPWGLVHGSGCAFLVCQVHWAGKALGAEWEERTRAALKVPGICWNGRKVLLMPSPGLVFPPTLFCKNRN